ncbi:hypothetical protein JJQ72_03135 [Paenibacillus sp. F411]|uniref:hypothetical protein n=1 Tax=Paenibacillus sp. F411 TaxID=2820239 RepID=UPI001AAE1CF2|nr:hypothetical protein [Paenibacillus sp. F411]MBO2942973.1 hypothetical protein [Paenibacillus sp. F411]
MKHRYFALSLCLIILTTLILGCEKERQGPPTDVLSQKEGKYVLCIVSNSVEFDFEVNKVVNADNALLNAIDKVVVHHTEDEREMWHKLGVNEFPSVVVLDSTKIVFQSTDPSMLNDFAITHGK